MRKTCHVALLVVACGLLLTSLADADSSYKKSRWASQLRKGTLKVQGAGYGRWGKRWIIVDTKVKAYREVGTSMGPVLVYRKAKYWHVVQLRFDTGAKLNRLWFKQPVTIVRGGHKGALLRVGDRCYNYSASKCVDYCSFDCKTVRFE